MVFASRLGHRENLERGGHTDNSNYRSIWRNLPVKRTYVGLKFFSISQTVPLYNTEAFSLFFLSMARNLCFNLITDMNEVKYFTYNL